VESLSSKQYECDISSWMIGVRYYKMETVCVPINCFTGRVNIRTFGECFHYPKSLLQLTRFFAQHMIYSVI